MLKLFIIERRGKSIVWHQEGFLAPISSARAEELFGSESESERINLKQHRMQGVSRTKPLRTI
jgi:hypothetical protein